MISCLCKTLSSVRAAASFVVLKDLNFLQKPLLLIPASNRYYGSTNAADQQPFAVSYLINSCGLSPESALRVSKHVNFETLEKPDAFLCFLKSHGFSQPQIINIIERRPTLLLYDIEKNLSPKFEFFYSKGLINWHLAKHPDILQQSRHGSVIPNLNFFKNLTDHDDDKKVLFAFFCGSCCLLESKYQSLFVSNLRLLQEYGVPESYAMTECIKHPLIFIVKHDKFKAAVEQVRKLGFDPLRSLEKRIILRCSVLQYLLSKGLIEEDYDVQRVLMCTEKQFILKFLTPFEDPHLLKLYEEKPGLSK
ncbi:hypothetical protein DITRI_Ditri08aG0016800 [Diplodiscus trichospermus]